MTKIVKKTQYIRFGFGTPDIWCQVVRHTPGTYLFH